MPFGKHKGELIGDIPTDYLRWLFEKADLDPKLEEWVEGRTDRAGGRLTRRQETPL